MVTTIGGFDLKMSEIMSEDAASTLRSLRLRRSKVRASRAEGAASVGHRDYRQGAWGYLLYPLKDALRDP